ncbi:conserved hypothetical protein [Methanothermus fervidus DSM 2088]|uniref:Uncharacterized protein n=1 Tax=Methanothermus fervidus (strain ATCC 43054 / DSM 2088 / JCM 10308 / V24 S) TaxID=523846 RepID=E3GX21_METFV|nr:hypothetical protein [Methanothermus fervidus]ADP76910.1 conserved hypothetical protein [Methanothermus fervidus DSM 2088]
MKKKVVCKFNNEDIKALNEIKKFYYEKSGLKLTYSEIIKIAIKSYAKKLKEEK